MKIKSLLAAVSVAAMAASAANAIELDQTNTTFDAPLALELDLANSPVVGNVTLDLTLTSAGNFPAGDVLTIIVTLPAGATFAAAVQGTDITTDGTGIGHPAFGSVIAGGAPGDSTVSFNLGVPTSPTTTDNIGFDFDIAVNSCDLDAGINVTAQLSGGAFVEGDTDGNSDDVFGNAGAPSCQSAFNGAVMSDEGVSDTTISVAAVPTYSALNEAGVTVPLNTPTNLGAVVYTIDPATGVDAAGTSMVAADITSVVSVVSFTNSSGALTFSADNGAVVAVAPGQANSILTGAEALAGSSLDMESDGTDAIVSQSVTVTAATVSFDQTVGAPEFITSEPGAIGGIDTLGREGQTFGVFDWNGSNPAGTISIYRITGLTGPTVFTVTLSNSADNGIFTGTVTPDATGEAIITSVDFGLPVPPMFVRADVEFNFETGNMLDVDRLLARNGIVTNFGGGANFSDNSDANTPSNDSDTVSE